MSSKKEEKAQAAAERIKAAALSAAQGLSCAQAEMQLQQQPGMTQQLRNPKLRMAESISYDLDNADATKKKEEKAKSSKKSKRNHQSVTNSVHHPIQMKKRGGGGKRSSKREGGRRRRYTSSKSSESNSVSESDSDNRKSRRKRSIAINIEEAVNIYIALQLLLQTFVKLLLRHLLCVQLVCGDSLHCHLGLVMG
ncbi:zinc finger CCHC domain-containing protein 10-like [Quillaja saponaria]|uniref:Zinc finger CCHC domain-containing protein 10-like n=1 Tax=Quillaja saponaria TaxID=32244 RepID=A0AAD7LBX6_QUISA|nr:zinc finger CCHC domain-containing protein 10-like [Quillaja saponaria]